MKKVEVKINCETCGGSGKVKSQTYVICKGCKEVFSIEVLDSFKLPCGHSTKNNLALADYKICVECGGDGGDTVERFVDDAGNEYDSCAYCEGADIPGHDCISLEEAISRRKAKREKEGN